MAFQEPLLPAGWGLPAPARGFGATAAFLSIPGRHFFPLCIKLISVFYFFSRNLDFFGNEHSITLY